MITNIQALRALAALLVLAYHATQQLVAMDHNYDFLTPFANQGFVGVDIFFVISGFVISLTTTDQPRNFQSIITFTRNRLARIYLGYWPFLLLTYLVLARFHPSGLSDFNLLDSLFLYHNQMNYLLTVAWSLTYELYFYLILIPIFFVPQKYLKQLMILLFVLIGSANAFNRAEINSTRWFLTNPYLLEFLSGAIIYHYQSSLIHKKFLPLLIPAGILGFYFGNSNDYNLGLPRVLTYGIFAVSVFYIFMILEKEKLFTFGKQWHKFGDASYTIYLSHIPVFYAFYFSGCRNWLSHQHALVIMGSFILIIIYILFFSLEFYRIVEAPLYHKVRK